MTSSRIASLLLTTPKQFSLFKFFITTKNISFLFFFNFILRTTDMVDKPFRKLWTKKVWGEGWGHSWNALTIICFQKTNMAGKRQGQKKYTCESVVCVWLTLHVYVGDQGDELDMKQCTRIHRVHTLKGHTTVKSSSWFIAFPCAKYCWGSKGIVGKRFGQSHTSGIQKNGAPDCHFSPYSAPPPPSPIYIL